MSQSEGLSDGLADKVCLKRERLTDERFLKIQQIIHTCRYTLRSQLPRLLSLAYWSRVWIAQELLLTNRPIIFSGPIELPFDHLAHVIQELEIPCNVYRSSLSMDYIQWRYLRLWTRPTHLSLVSLLQHYSGAECFDERDRIYALLSIASDGHRVVPDYTVDKGTLFRNMLSGFMPGNTIDDLLNFCATLIENLQIIPLQLTEDLAYGSSLEINTPTQTSVGLPIWRYTSLRPMTSIHEPSYHETPIICIYIPIFDGPDIHVLECATELSGTKIYVLYTRAHEYLVGTPKLPADPMVPTADSTMLWLSNPSEQLYYYPYLKNTDARPSALWSWDPPTSHILPLSASRNDTTSPHNRARMQPSQRRISKSHITGTGRIHQSASRFVCSEDRFLRQLRRQCNVSCDSYESREESSDHLTLVIIPRPADVHVQAPMARSCSVRLTVGVKRLGSRINDHRADRTLHPHEQSSLSYLQLVPKCIYILHTKRGREVYSV